jgi:putative FmdB family regulatory protein
MPIYEYICQECDEKFSLLQSVHVSEKETSCPKCASKKVKKLLSTFSYSASSLSDLTSSLSGKGVSGGT